MAAAPLSAAMMLRGLPVTVFRLWQGQLENNIKTPTKKTDFFSYFNLGSSAYS